LGSNSRAAKGSRDGERAHQDQPRAEDDGDGEQARLGPDDDQDAGGDRHQAGDHVGLTDACIDAGRQRLGDALEDEAPMNVARSRIVHSMLKTRSPATIRTAPLSRRTHQLRATCLAASRVSL
jgi:hypothetical protein